jgi:hypothetical protein
LDFRFAGGGSGAKLKYGLQNAGGHDGGVAVEP